MVAQDFQVPIQASEAAGNRGLVAVEQRLEGNVEG
jgi:hypothetical protein